MDKKIKRKKGKNTSNVDQNIGDVALEWHEMIKLNLKVHGSSKKKRTNLQKYSQTKGSEIDAFERMRKIWFWWSKKRKHKREQKIEENIYIYVTTV